jgi:hypothetical protein
MGELDGDAGADGGEELDVAHARQHRHTVPDRQ